MEKEIKIKIFSKQFELSKALMEKLFEIMESEDDEEYYDEDEGIEASDSEPMELTTYGYLSVDKDRVKITYDESELTGMEGATTTLSFDKSAPELLTMLRGGSVTTAMVFEPRQRHICVYETPIMPFELCIYTLKVENDLLKSGNIYLDYIVEFKGAQAERTKFTISIEEITNAEAPLDEYENV